MFLFPKFLSEHKETQWENDVKNYFPIGQTLLKVAQPSCDVSIATTEYSFCNHEVAGFMTSNLVINGTVKKLEKALLRTFSPLLNHQQFHLSTVHFVSWSALPAPHLLGRSCLLAK